MSAVEQIDWNVNDKPYDKITIILERVYIEGAGPKDLELLELRDCYEPEEILGIKSRPELTSLAKMMLKLAKKQGELHEHPDIIQSIREIVA